MWLGLPGSDSPIPRRLGEGPPDRRNGPMNRDLSSQYRNRTPSFQKPSPSSLFLRQSLPLRRLPRSSGKGVSRASGPRSPDPGSEPPGENFCSVRASEERPSPTSEDHGFRGRK